MTLGHRIPDIVFNALRRLNFPITRIVCFTTQDSKVIRDAKEKEEKLIKVEKYHYQYRYREDFCNLDSKLYQHDLDHILREELKSANLILDLTPMSKLFSF
ncbi:MAG: hypothetical protein K9W44_14565 [Candidatus Lokiarchaeota archaeon]|nr:hypothetical protein [Candidatus Harpocratesius repetitus]